MNKIHSGVRVTVGHEQNTFRCKSYSGHEQNEVGEYFKYIGSIKSTDGNCNNDARSRIGMAMKIMKLVDPYARWCERFKHFARVQKAGL